MILKNILSKKESVTKEHIYNYIYMNCPELGKFIERK